MKTETGFPETETGILCRRKTPSLSPSISLAISAVNYNHFLASKDGPAVRFQLISSNINTASAAIAAS